MLSNVKLGDMVWMKVKAPTKNFGDIYIYAMVELVILTDKTAIVKPIGNNKQLEVDLDLLYNRPDKSGGFY